MLTQITRLYSALTVSLLGLMKERDNELAAGAHHAHATQDERRGKGLSGFLRRFSRKKDKKTAIARVPSEEEDSTPRRMSTQSRAWITPTPVIPTSHQRSPAIPRRRVASQPTNKIWSVNDASWEDAILGYRPRGKLPQSAPRKNQDKELDIDLSVGHVDDHNITSSFACTGVRDFERLRANLEAQEGGWMCSRQSTAFSTTSSTSEESIKPWSTVAGLNSPQARPSFDVWYPEPALIRYGDCERAMQAGETLRRGDGFVAEKLHAGLEAMKREELKIDVDNNGYGGAAIYRYGQFKHEAEAAATTESQSLAFSTPVANQRFSAFSLTSSTRRVSNPLDGVVAPPRQTLPSLTPNLFGYGVNPVEAQDDGREVCDEKAVIRSTDSLVTLPCADPIAMWPKYWDSVSGSSDTPISTPGRSSVGRFASDFPGHEIVGDPDATITCKHATGSSRNISRGMPEAVRRTWFLMFSSCGALTVTACFRTIPTPPSTPVATTLARTHPSHSYAFRRSLDPCS